MAAQKISLYNLTELRTTTDDALGPLLTSLPGNYKFTQQHFYANVRLVLGYLAVTIAGILFYADWKLGWDATKAYTAPACVAYFLLNGALTYWVWGIESGKVFVGTRPGGQKLTLSSSVTKNVPIYKLKIRYEAPETGARFVDDETIEGHFTEWFNIHGFLDKKAFRRWLAGNIEVVGLADPQAKKEWDDAREEERVDEEVVSEGARMSGAISPSAVTDSAKKRGRPRKA